MPPGLSQFPISKSTQSGSWCHLHPINQPPILACSFGTVGRSRTHVLSESFFPNDIKLTYFLGLDTETFFPPNKKGFWELLWAQNGVWSHQKVDLRNSGSFFGWSKKGSGLTRLVGQVSFPSRILFFSERKRFWPLTNFIVLLITEVQEDFETLLKNSMWHSGSFLQGAKKGLGGFSGSIKPLKPRLRSERAFQNVRFLRSAFWSWSQLMAGSTWRGPLDGTATKLPPLTKSVEGWPSSLEPNLSASSTGSMGSTELKPLHQFR